MLSNHNLKECVFKVLTTFDAIVSTYNVSTRYKRGNIVKADRFIKTICELRLCKEDSHYDDPEDVYGEIFEAALSCKSMKLINEFNSVYVEANGDKKAKLMLLGPIMNEYKIRRRCKLGITT